MNVAATPIGNLGDLSGRLKDALSAAELVLAEDTRRTRKLYSALGLSLAGRELVSFNAHNEHKRVEGVLDALRRGLEVLLVSDAGSPGLYAI